MQKEEKRGLGFSRIITGDREWTIVFNSYFTLDYLVKGNNVQMDLSRTVEKRRNWQPKEMVTKPLEYI